MVHNLGRGAVRVTVRLPHVLYEELSALLPSSTGYRGASWLIRKALMHYLACPERLQADAAAAAELHDLLVRRA